MKKFCRFILLVTLVMPGKDVMSQNSMPDTVHAVFSSMSPVFDGKLSEPLWQTATAITNFTQRELDFGKPSSERTKVAIVYDQLALYIGVWCYQQPGSIRAK